MVWEVRVNDCMGGITNFNGDHAHVEMHDAEHRETPERGAYQLFSMNMPCWTDRVRMTFHRNRDGVEIADCIQLEAIQFYG